MVQDNGPHTLIDKDSLDPEGGHRSGGQLAATNGLRQCKASVFEGGIRVPSFISWPAMLRGRHGGDDGGSGGAKHTSFMGSSLDFMATVNEILGTPYPKPTWALDSTSLLPLLDGRLPLDIARHKPLGWQLGSQRALANQTTGADGVTAVTWKIVERPAKGQCDDWLPPYEENVHGPLLFHLESDPTESVDLCKSQPVQCAAMVALMDEYMAGVNASAFFESKCALRVPTRRLLSRPAT